MYRSRIAAAALLCTALALALPGANAQPPAPTPTPVPLTPALKTALAKRVTIEKAMEGTPAELLQKLAAEHKFKIAIDDDPKVERIGVVGKEKTSIPAQKDVRLDIIINDLLLRNGGVVFCVVRKDTLVIVDPSQATVKLPGNRVGVQTILQPPDATHLAATAPIKKKLAAKVDAVADNTAPVFEFLQKVAKQNDLKFLVAEEEFRKEGVMDFKESKVTVKAAKGITVEAMLRDTLKSVNAQVALDPYTGELKVTPLPAKK